MRRLFQRHVTHGDQIAKVLGESVARRRPADDGLCGVVRRELHVEVLGRRVMIEASDDRLEAIFGARSVTVRCDDDDVEQVLLASFQIANGEFRFIGAVALSLSVHVLQPKQQDSKYYKNMKNVNQQMNARKHEITLTEPP